MMLRKFSGVFGLLLLSQLANAQFSKGDYMIEANALASVNDNSFEATYNSRSYSSGYLSLNAGIGRFITNNQLVGVRFIHSNTNSTNSSNSFSPYTMNSIDVQIGGDLFWRKYWKLTESFYTYLDVSAGYSYLTGSSDYYGPAQDAINEETTGNLGRIGGKLGLAYRLSSKFTIQAHLIDAAGNMWATDIDGTDAQGVSYHNQEQGTDIDLSLFSTPNIGLTWIF